MDILIVLYLFPPPPFSPQNGEIADFSCFGRGIYSVPPSTHSRVSKCVVTTVGVQHSVARMATLVVILCTRGSALARI